MRIWTAESGNPATLSTSSNTELAGEPASRPANASGTRDFQRHRSAPAGFLLSLSESERAVERLPCWRSSAGLSEFSRSAKKLEGSGLEAEQFPDEMVRSQRQTGACCPSELAMIG
ncbi:hypothetical protein MHYP_G00292480 [Metynnis hypsauchen]